MLPTEAQAVKWFLENWPSVVISCSVAFIYIAAYLRLQKFLQKQAELEKQLVKVTQDIIHLENLVTALVLNHCQKYPPEMADLMALALPQRKESIDGKPRD